MKLALPTGDLREPMGVLLGEAGFAAEGYEPGSRLLRSEANADGIRFRIFRERDIPIQVALGNYDAGICGDVWFSELQVRFPHQRVVRVGSLPGPTTDLWLCAAPGSGLRAGQVPAGRALDGVRIGTEFPNLADLLAAHLRIPRYTLLNLYGSADPYPPEDADLAVVPARDAEAVEALGLVPLHRIFAGGVAVVANASALAGSDCSRLLELLAPRFVAAQPGLDLPHGDEGLALRRESRRTDVLRLALPDGHAQRHTAVALAEAGLVFAGYEEKHFVRRPASGIEGLEIKVIRPQDMAQQVAIGAFDLAVSGVDRLREHLSEFPSSPVEMAVDLGRSRYRIGPVVHQDFPADTTAEALPIWHALGRPLRIASELPALAEAFARDFHLPHTAIIPIAGASEAFVPEDADVLVEGTETGNSLRANNLKMLDPFLESTNCVLVRKEPVTERRDLLATLIERLRQAAPAPVPS